VWHAGDGSKFRWTLPGGQKPKDLIGIPWRVAFALQADGWWLRSDIIWHKPNPMPESVRDRCTKAHEYIFLLSKSTRYYYDAEAIAEPAIYSGRVTGRGLGKDAGRHPSGQSQLSNVGGFPLKSPTRNRRSVWTINPQPYAGAHFATFPPKLIEPCILAGCPEAGTVLDPFFGAGTTGLVAERHNRRWIGCELNPEYAELARRRIEAQRDMFSLQTLVEGR
jgi:DNA modification methylase